MPSATRLLLASSLVVVAIAPGATAPPDRRQVLATMKRATTFMIDKVATGGGYVWTYLPDLSRRWGELEARPTMIWLQPPGTPTMGQLFLDAYHATRDPAYYVAARAVAAALARAQHPSGGWNYVADFAGEPSLREWYATVGKNAWRLEEFQHYYGNATFDDGGTAESTRFLVRLFVERRDPEVGKTLDQALRFLLDSQYPNGAWPQRYPLMDGFSKDGHADYTAYPTFNDDVAARNIDVLAEVLSVLGDERMRDPLQRAMRSYLLTQQAAPQAGWALQYTPDLQPAAARTYEPKALATHGTAAAIDQLLKFYRWTGDRAYLARVPDALAWLESCRLPANLAVNGATHPTFVELGTNRPLYLHRRGSNVVNGRYEVDGEPAETIGHYGSVRTIDTARLRREYEALLRQPEAEVTKDSPLRVRPGSAPAPRFAIATSHDDRREAGPDPDVASLVAALNVEGYWPSELGMTSHPFTRDGSAVVAPGRFTRTQVGDETDTSPFRTDGVLGISTATYIRNMSVLIRHLQTNGGSR